jgi:Amino acid permease
VVRNAGLDELRAFASVAEPFIERGDRRLGVQDELAARACRALERLHQRAPRAAAPERKKDNDALGLDRVVGERAKTCRADHLIRADGDRAVKADHRGFVMFVALGFALGDGTMRHLAESCPVAPTGWLLALIPVMFTYSGRNAASYVAEEIRDPRSLATSISAMTFAGPRVYFAMARDRLFLGGAARVHPRYRTPAPATIVQAAWSLLLVLSAKVDARQLHGVCDRALLRRGGGCAVRAAGPRAAGHARLRTWGYPVSPALYVVASALILLNGCVSRPLPAGAGLLVMGGMPFYWWFSRRS